MRPLFSFLAVLLLFGLLAAPTPTLAQPTGYYVVPLHRAGHNPGELNTEAEDFAPPVGWHQLMMADARIQQVPRWSPVDSLPVGFAFQLGGQPVRRFKVSSTGVLTFDVAAVPVPSAVPALLPNSRIPARSICVWGMAMDTAYAFFSFPRNDGTSRILTRTFGTAPNRQFWVQLRCFGLPSAPQGAIARLKSNWSIVLEETTNAVYVVDQRTRRYNSTDALALTVGVQLSATQATMAPGAPAINSDCYTGEPGSLMLSVAAPHDNTYYAFYPGTPPAADLALETAPLARYRAPGAGPLTLRGRVRNMGTQAATGYTIGYRINNAPPVLAAYTGGAVSAAAADSFRIVAPWHPPGAGTYRVKIWTRRAGTTPDAVPANDTLVRVVQVADRTVPRRFLLEMNTSSTCPPCLPANDSLRQLLRRHAGPVTVVKYQQNYPGEGDPYATPETLGRFLYYYGGYIPFTTLNGRDPGVSGGQLTDSMLVAAAAAPAVVALDAVYTVQGQTVTTAARVLPHLSATANQLVLHTLVLERRTFLNVMTNGETEFDNVVKKLLPDLGGAPLGALTAGQWRDVPHTYTFPTPNTVESFDSLFVVVFVQDVNTREVLQSAVARAGGVLGEAPETTAPAVSLAVAPNPATGRATARFTLEKTEPVALAVYDALGRTVLTLPARALPAGPHALPIHLRSAAPGVYAVRLTIGGQHYSRRLVVE